VLQVEGQRCEAVSPHPQGLQGSRLNLSQTSAKRLGRIFFSITRLCESQTSAQTAP